MLANSPFSKDQRRKSLERKQLDKQNKRNPMARDLRTPKYNPRVVDTQERGGAKSLIRTLVYSNADQMENIL